MRLTHLSSRIDALWLWHGEAFRKRGEQFDRFLGPGVSDAINCSDGLGDVAQELG